jgi:hypothetical protein
MNNLSERVQREFESWKEKYEIPDHMEFEVKTLLKLQEEYDEVYKGSNTTKTRESLLNMIHRLHMSMRLTEKINITKPMYVDCIRLDTKEDSQRGMLKVVIYIGDQIISLDNRIYLNSKDYAHAIYNLAKETKSIIYIDTRNFGMVIYDELIKFTDLQIVKLRVNFNSIY